MPRSLWKRITDPFGRLFGDDLFISYSHADAREYGVALAARLEKHLQTYVDRYTSRAGTEIPEEVMDHLMRATMLVVVASPGSASRDSFVGREVEEFAPTGRQIIAVNVGGALETCPWKELVTGLSRPDEAASRLDPPRPSIEVRRSILRSFNYLTRAEVRRRVSLAIVVSTLLVTALLGMQAWTAAIAAEDAELTAASIELLTRQKERAAQKRIGIAESGRKTAAAEAERQRGISAAQRIATIVEAVWQSESAPVDDVLLAAAESLRRGATPTAFRVVSEALPLRAKPAGQHEIDAIEAAVSPDGKWIAAYGGDADTVLRRGSKKPLRTQDACYGASVRFDRRSTYAAFTCRSGDEAYIRVIDLKSGEPRVPDIPAKGEDAGLYSLENGVEAFFDGAKSGGVLTITSPTQGRLQFPAQRVHVSPDGLAVLLRTSEHELELRRPNEYDPPVARLHATACIGPVAYSRARSNDTSFYVAVGAVPCGTSSSDTESEVVLYGAFNGEERGRFPVAGFVRALAVSEQGREVAVITSSKGDGREGEITLYRSNDFSPPQYEKQWTRPTSWRDEEKVAAPHFLPRDDYEYWQSAVVYLDNDTLRVAGPGGRELLRISNDVGSFLLTKDRLMTVESSSVRFWYFPPLPPPPPRPGSKILTVNDATVDPRWKESAAARSFLAGRTPTHSFMSNDGRRLLIATYGEGGQYPTAVIGLPADRLLYDFHFPEGFIRHIAFSPDGSRVVAVPIGTTPVYVHDLQGRKPAEIGGTPVGTTHAAISSDGILLALAGHDGITLQSSSGGAVQWRIAEPGTVAGIQFDAAASRVAVVLDRYRDNPERRAANDRYTVMVIDVPSGTVTYRVQVADPIRSIVFRDSDLIARGHDNTTRTFSIDPIETARTLCRTIGQSLDRDSWARLVRDPYVETCKELRRAAAPR